MTGGVCGGVPPMACGDDDDDAEADADADSDAEEEGVGVGVGVATAALPCRSGRGGLAGGLGDGVALDADDAGASTGAVSLSSRGAVPLLAAVPVLVPLLLLLLVLVSLQLDDTSAAAALDANGRIGIGSMVRGRSRALFGAAVALPVDGRTTAEDRAGPEAERCDALGPAAPAAAAPTGGDGIGPPRRAGGSGCVPAPRPPPPPAAGPAGSLTPWTRFSGDRPASPLASMWALQGSLRAACCHHTMNQRRETTTPLERFFAAAQIFAFSRRCQADELASDSTLHSTHKPTRSLRAPLANRLRWK